jgi:hypothetical protein
MKLAGKYATASASSYSPDIFPSQQLMHSLAKQTNNNELKNALLEFQYPFKLSDLENSNYSPTTKQAVLNVVTTAQN